MSHENLIKNILSYLKREKERAEKAVCACQDDKNSARVHEIDNVCHVIEWMIEKNMPNLAATEFKFQKLHPDAKIPQKAHPSDAGFDVFAMESAVIKAGSPVLLRTGLRCEIPEGWEIQIRPKSGLSLKHGLIMLNSPATIDANYRGEIGVILSLLPNLYEIDVNEYSDNTGHSVYLSSEQVLVIEKGQKIAQMVFQRVENVVLTEVQEVDTKTDRGEGGFGSTGK